MRDLGFCCKPLSTHGRGKKGRLTCETGKIEPHCSLRLQTFHSPPPIKCVHPQETPSLYPQKPQSTSNPPNGATKPHPQPRASRARQNRLQPPPATQREEDTVPSTSQSALSLTIITASLQNQHSPQPSPTMSTPPLLQRPIPRRPFDTDDLTPTSPDDDSPPKRSRSAVSLTASTLFGIYGRAFTEEPSTPLATRNNSTTNLVSLEPAKPVPRPRYNPPSSPATLLTRSISLFALGLAYGVVVTHLHDRSPMLLSLPSDRWGGAYLAFWGLAGVALGCVLPWLDAGEAPPERKWDWSPAVRGIGAFVGIAYGIVSPPTQYMVMVVVANGGSDDSRGNRPCRSRSRWLW